MAIPEQKSISGFPPCVSLTIDFNPHAIVYETIEQWLEYSEEHLEWTHPSERQKAIDTNSIWICQWFPITPVGSCSVAASTFNALMAALAFLQDHTVRT